jgi:putative membrane protein
MRKIGWAVVASLALPGVASAHAGYEHDAATTVWQPAPLVLAGAGLALALFARAFLRLRLRGRSDLAPAWRAVLFVAGLALLVGPLVSPLDAIGEDELLSAHMLQHVLIGDAAPAVILLALRGPLVFLVVPATVLRAVGRSPAVRRGLRLVLRPPVSFGLWAGAIAFWHVPAVYETALRSQPVHDAQHLSFVVAGFLAWNQLVDPARRGTLSVQGRLAFAFGMLVLGGVLANVLVVAGDPIYPHYAVAGQRLTGLSPGRDQDVAALVMMLEQMIALGAVFAVGLRAYLRAPAAPVPGAAERHPFAL